jgi:hypothetical protein
MGAVLGVLPGAACGALFSPSDRLQFSDPEMRHASTWIQLPSTYVETDTSFIFPWNGRSRTVSKAGLRIKRSGGEIRILLPTAWLDEQ